MIMKKGKIFLWLAVTAVTVHLPLISDYSIRNSGAEDKYPSRSIEIFCGFAPGGVTDTLTRLVARKLEQNLKVTVVPGNKPGGGEVIAASALANSPPDGYTLAILGDASLITSHLLGRATYSKDDLRVIGEFVFISNVLAVSAESPWKTIKDFIEHARKNPGLTFSHPGVGSSPFLRAEYFNKVAKLNMKGVPFKGDPEGIAAVLGKHVAIGVFSGMAAKKQEEGGKMRMLFCFDPPGLSPNPNIPNIPSYFGKEVPDIDPVSNYLVAPGKASEGVVKVLENTLEKITKDPEFVDNMNKMSIGIRFTDSKSVTQLLERKTSQIKPILLETGLIK